ncbi:MAG: AbrB/MazE/SpoVT family DNA-binding domain-containing protein [Planctomycetes bacterium]|jgi:AbrB family looped-hinge helix DNA binding protein|nr:AbrB/MazE/SpoVT family DNA-binding domain-containing protein [Planctomycetota bacterium]
MKVTTKGQVTIPLAVRRKLGIVAGTEVEFVEEIGRVVVRKTGAGGRGRALVARMRGRGSVRMSTDEILSLTRGPRR